MSYILKTEGLTKKYGGRAVVDHVNMTIEKGDIYGFIGKNGAGKTTLMRMVLSLAKPTSGTISLFDGVSAREAGKRIGSLIEAPGLYKNCTAYENMVRFSIAAGADQSEIPAILELVGLSDVKKKKVKQFSLGMKQRLGIAVALIGNPEFLVLDEPVNGLDPEGIKEVRDLMVKLNRERGITVLISSHLLDELSKIATRYGIINSGKLVEEVTAKQLEALSGQRLEIGVDRPAEARQLLAPHVGEYNIEVTQDSVILKSGVERSAEWNTLLAANGFSVSSLTVLSGGLEQYFIERVNG